MRLLCMNSNSLGPSTANRNYLWWSPNFHKGNDNRDLVRQYNVEWGPHEKHTKSNKDTAKICAHCMETIENMARQEIAIHCNWKMAWTYRKTLRITYLLWKCSKQI